MHQAEQTLLERLDSAIPTPEDFFLLSILALEAGQPEAGIDRLQQALRLLPSHPQLQAQMAALWQARFYPDRALACLDQAGTLVSDEGRGALLGAVGDTKAVTGLLRNNRCHLPVQFRFSAREEEEIFLTLDDGPSSAATADLLSLLDQASSSSQWPIRAGFFLCGFRAAQEPGLLRRMAVAGHGIFSHGFDHRSFSSLSAVQIQEQLEQTEAILSLVRPTPSPYPIRLPYGKGWLDPYVHDAIAAWREDCVLVQWSFDPGDWRVARQIQAQALLPIQRLALSRRIDDFFASRYRSGAIIVLHDLLADSSAGQQAADGGTVARTVLETFVTALQREGMTAADPRDARLFSSSGTEPVRHALIPFSLQKTDAGSAAFREERLHG